MAAAIDSKHQPYSALLNRPRLHMPNGEEVLPLVRPRIEVRDLSTETTIINEFVLTQLKNFATGIGFSKPCPFDDLSEIFFALNEDGWCSTLSATGHQVAKLTVFAGGVAYAFLDKVDHEWLKTLSPVYAGALAASVVAISWLSDRWFTKTDVGEAQNLREYQRLIGMVASQYERMGQVALIYFLVYEQDVSSDYRKSPSHERTSPDRNEMVQLADKIISNLSEIASWIKRELKLKKTPDAYEILYPLEAALKVIRSIAHNAKLGAKREDVRMLDFYKEKKARFADLLVKEEVFFTMRKLITEQAHDRTLNLENMRLRLRLEIAINHFQSANAHLYMQIKALQKAQSAIELDTRQSQGKFQIFMAHERRFLDLLDKLYDLMPNDFKLIKVPALRPSSLAPAIGPRLLPNPHSSPINVPALRPGGSELRLRFTPSKPTAPAAPSTPKAAAGAAQSDPPNTV